MDAVFLEVINSQTLVDSQTRHRGEEMLQSATSQDPSGLAAALAGLATREGLPVHVRQAALLHLKQLVPRHWSLAFDLFVGPAVTSPVKGAVRAALLACAVHPEPRLRSGAAYAIVQVAVADYPDEWPTLLDELYTHMCSANPAAMLGAVVVLRDLFDDLVTEEHFFEGGVGNAVIQHTMTVLASGAVEEVAVAVARLYRVALRQLTSEAAQAAPDRQAAVDGHIPQIVRLVNLLLANPARPAGCGLQAQLYKILYVAVNTFGRVYPDAALAESQRLALGSLAALVGPYVAHVVEVEGPDAGVAAAVTEALQFMGSIHHLPFAAAALPAVFAVVMRLAACPAAARERYEDVNEYVTDRAGLSARFEPRDAINEYLGELNETDAAPMLCAAITALSAGTNAGAAGTNAANAEETTSALPPLPEWMATEANLFLLEGLFANENLATVELPARAFDALVAHLAHPHALVAAAAVAVMPRFLDRCASRLGVVAYAEKALNAVFARAESSSLVTAAALISLNGFALVLEDAGATLPTTVHGTVVGAIARLLPEAADDTYGVLLEALTLVIGSGPAACAPELLDMIFTISLKDPGNIQVVVDARDALEALVSRCDAAAYATYCGRVVPGLVSAIGAETQAAEGAIAYTATLSLNLELLGLFVAHAPAGAVPAEVFGYVFPVLTTILLQPLEDLILQTAVAALLAFLDRAPALVAPQMPTVLRIVERLLSPTMSDRAAQDAGSVVVALVAQYRAVLGAHVTPVLEAAALRLVHALELVTIENLVMVFCHLVLLSPTDTVSFLSAFTLHGQTGLQLVLPVWFRSFEVTRGYAKIRLNVMALSQLYALNDERINALEVDGSILPYDGDLIVTRSMAAKMPPRYTRVSAPRKILSLLVGELDFQTQQPETVEAEEGEGWEDLDASPSFEQLQEYAEGREPEAADEETSLKDLLVAFFKECAAHNVAGFAQHYEQWSLEEKAVLARVF